MGFKSEIVARTMKRELQALAEILAEWINPAPGIPAVYLFGSRVRGDHRPNSDVDVRLYLDEGATLVR
jgi:predicted nucleotidyltransferase